MDFCSLHSCSVAVRRLEVRCRPVLNLSSSSKDVSPSLAVGSDLEVKRAMLLLILFLYLSEILCYTSFS